MALNWAVDKNSDKAEDPKLLDSSVREIIWFNISEFIAHMDYPWIIDPNNFIRNQGVRRGAQLLAAGNRYKIMQKTAISAK